MSVISFNAIAAGTVIATDDADTDCADDDDDADDSPQVQIVLKSI